MNSSEDGQPVVGRFSSPLPEPGRQAGSNAAHSKGNRRANDDRDELFCVTALCASGLRYSQAKLRESTATVIRGFPWGEPRDTVRLG